MQFFLYAQNDMQRPETLFGLGVVSVYTDDEIDFVSRQQRIWTTFGGFVQSIMGHFGIHGDVHDFAVFSVMEPGWGVEPRRQQVSLTEPFFSRAGVVLKQIETLATYGFTWRKVDRRRQLIYVDEGGLEGTTPAGMLGNNR